MEREAERLICLHEIWQLKFNTATSKNNLEEAHAKTQKIKDKIQHTDDLIAATESDIVVQIDAKVVRKIAIFYFVFISPGNRIRIIRIFIFK